jgi:hypothetical protein
MKSKASLLSGLMLLIPLQLAGGLWAPASAAQRSNLRIGFGASVSVSPSTVTLTGGQSQAFSATVSGSRGQAVTWSLSPAVGTISTSGVYAAPATVTAAQSVTVIATTATRPSSSGSGTVKLTPPAASQGTITLSPTSFNFGTIDVGTTAAETFTVSNTGTAAVTFSSATISGAGFNASGISQGTVINPSSSTTENVTFTPASTVSVTGTLSFASNATNSSLSAGLTGAGTQPATYYLAPASAGGSDSNNGTSAATPWLTPNHKVNCGDVIIAAASTAYSDDNFQTWGAVTCSGNNVAWLKCATFDACKISATDGSGMVIGSSYWGVQGWEVTTSTAPYAACFEAQPPSSTNIHHIIFANDIANGCQAGGFQAVDNGSSSSVDYVAFVGDIAYNTTQNGSECYSGFNIYQPSQSDSLAGTHIYIAGNYSWANVDPNPCAGGKPTDGEGIILDTINDSQGGPTPAYAAQIAVEQNIVFYNGGRGITVFQNTSAPIYVQYNTSFGNNTDTTQGNTFCGDIIVGNASSAQILYNIFRTNAATGCGTATQDVMYVFSSTSTVNLDYNFGYSQWGYNTGGSGNASAFAFGSHNVFGTDPKFANPVKPAAPSCSSFASVPACMATVIADYTPANASAGAYGYQPITTAAVVDPLFPQWLCNVNLPSGLVNMACSQ